MKFKEGDVVRIETEQGGPVVPGKIALILGTFDNPHTYEYEIHLFGIKDVWGGVESGMTLIHRPGQETEEIKTTNHISLGAINEQRK